MNYSTENVVAAAAAASQQQQQHQQYQQEREQEQPHHPHQHQHIIPLPSYSASQAAAIGGGGGGDGSPKNMEWTNDDALELIEQYRCHTELWNRADPKYKDKLCRFRAWSEIADRFGCSKAEVERKMNVLLTQYRREKHKMFVKIYQGIQPNPSKWYAFKRFDFMEAGGGSLSGLPSGAVANSSTSSTSSAGHNGLNGLAAAAVAAAAYESGTIAAAANGGAPVGGVGAAAAGLSATGATPPASQHHRRIKTKELKYFGAMALNIPLLIAGGQTLDNWNTAGQYSPPIGSAAAAAGGVAGVQQQQQQLRVPLPMSYVGAATPSAGGGGGGSSSSEFQPSPHKTIDTSDNEDNSNRDEATAAALGQLAAKVERRTPGLGGGGGGGRGTPGGSMDVGVAVEPGGEAAASAALSEAGSSPIPNTNTNPNVNPSSTTNMHEAHKPHQHPPQHHPHPPHPHPHQHQHLLQTSPTRAATPRQAHEQLPQHHSHHSHGHGHGHGHHAHHPDELDIKQELVDYFQGTPATTGAAQQPPPPRSYSSAGEESRSLQLDMAQDLRVAQAKAQASFGGFVLPPRSNSAQLAAMPLNMRKLSSNAGQLLMSSLMSSRESMSEDGEPDNDEATESAASPGHIKSSVSAQDASSAVQAAAALYAESLSRDDCDFVGSNVSMKLRTMDRTQRIIAEKLISEVLYFGQFNELERTARIQPK
ncbi:hypothetical protein KR093_004943 [Drosophila rubida]|uniref:MADF domain-containing protein n=1 Tax=Drosophila rubida TaxID=30044 RepID=A0AAD4K586_9MUSC|nr:hypothetical protein KR093_004943 [Drosophila rubida]